MARKKKDEDEPLDEQGNSDESFGLPDIDYQPLSRESEPAAEPTSSEPSSEQPTTESEPVQEEPAPAPEPMYSSYIEENKPSMAPRIIGILLLVIIAGLATWYFVVYQPKVKEKERQEALAKQQKAQQEEQARLAEEERQRAREQRRLDSLNNLPKAGSIETLSDRTGKYYVIAASAIDDDLLMDHARDLSAKNVSTVIIPPFGKSRFYRLGIANGGTFSEAQNTANSMKGQYGDALWVLKY